MTITTSRTEATHLWEQWFKSRRGFDVLEHRPRGINRRFLAPSVKGEHEAIAAAAAHSMRVGRRVILTLNPALSIFIDKGVVVARTDHPSASEEAHL